MQDEIIAVAPTIDNPLLRGVYAQALQKLGSQHATRLAEAATLVQAGAVKLLDGDFYVVSVYQPPHALRPTTYTCTLQGRQCNCRGRAPEQPGGGKLCVHRLAVMMLVRLEQAEAETLKGILQQPDAERASFKVSVYYGERKRERRYMLDGYKFVGTGGVQQRVLEYDERFPLTEAMFAAALRATGWIMRDRPVRDGMAYRYLLARPEPGEVYSLGLDAVAGNDLERWADEEKSAKFLAGIGL